MKKNIIELFFISVILLTYSSFLKAGDGSSTLEKINETIELINNGDLAERSKRHYLEVLDKTIKQINKEVSIIDNSVNDTRNKSIDDIDRIIDSINEKILEKSLDGISNLFDKLDNSVSNLSLEFERSFITVVDGSSIVITHLAKNIIIITSFSFLILYLFIIPIFLIRSKTKLIPSAKIGLGLSSIILIPLCLSILAYPNFQEKILKSLGYAYDLKQKTRVTSYFPKEQIIGKMTDTILNGFFDESIMEGFSKNKTSIYLYKGNKKIFKIPSKNITITTSSINISKFIENPSKKEFNEYLKKIDRSDRSYIRVFKDEDVVTHFKYKDFIKDKYGVSDGIYTLVLSNDGDFVTSVSTPFKLRYQDLKPKIFPDVIVDNISYSPKHPKAGGNLTVTVGIKIRNNKALGVNKMYVSVILNGVNKNIEVNNLKRSSSYIEKKVIFKNINEGDYKIQVMADTDGDVSNDTNYDNNKKDKNVEISTQTYSALVKIKSLDINFDAWCESKIKTDIEVGSTISSKDYSIYSEYLFTGESNKPKKGTTDIDKEKTINGLSRNDSVEIRANIDEIIEIYCVGYGAEGNVISHGDITKSYRVADGSKSVLSIGNDKFHVNAKIIIKKEN